MTMAPPDRPIERVRVGLIGLGAVAQAVHLPLLERLGSRFAIAAISDLSPSLVAAIGDRYHVPAPGRHLDAADLLEDDLDAVLILSSGSHGDLARLALDRGLPVFCEKPLAFTRTEADELSGRTDRGGRLQLGYMKLHDPAVVEAGRLLADGDRSPIGRLRSVEVTVLHPPSEPQLAHARLLPAPTDIPAAVLGPLLARRDELLDGALGSEAPIAVRRLYAEVLLGSVVHDLALVRAFAGDPLAITSAETWPDDRWPASVAIAGELPGGARLAIRWHFLESYPAYREEVRLIGEAGSLDLVFPSPYLLHAPTALTLTTPGSGAGSRRDDRYASVEEAFEQELLAFHDLVVNGAPPRAGVAAGRADIVTCQRIATAWARARSLQLGGEAAAG